MPGSVASSVRSQKSAASVRGSEPPLSDVSSAKNRPITSGPATDEQDGKKKFSYRQQNEMAVEKTPSEVSMKSSSISAASSSSHSSFTRASSSLRSSAAVRPVPRTGMAASVASTTTTALQAEILSMEQRLEKERRERKKAEKHLKTTEKELELMEKLLMNRSMPK